MALRRRRLCFLLLATTLAALAAAWPGGATFPGGGLLFTSGRDGNAEVYTMRPDGSELTSRTNSASSDQYAILSPDHLRYAYVTNASPARAALNPFLPIWSLSLNCILDPECCERLDFDPYKGHRDAWAGFGAALTGFHPSAVTFRPLTRAVGGGSTSFAPTWQPIRAGDLAVRIAGPARAKKGKPITYRFAVQSRLTGLTDDRVELTVTLPVGARVVSLDSACTRSGKTVSCDMGSLDLWRTREVVLKLRVNAPRRITLSPTVSGSLPDLDASRNTTTKTTTIR